MGFRGASENIFRIASGNMFGIASDLGVCDSNRVAHRGCIARFGPLSSQKKTRMPSALWFGTSQFKNGPCEKRPINREPFSPALPLNCVLNAISSKAEESERALNWVLLPLCYFPILSGIFKGGDLNPGERHSRVTRHDGTVTLCALRTATVLSRNCCSDFGVP